MGNDKCRRYRCLAIGQLSKNLAAELSAMMDVDHVERVEAALAGRVDVVLWCPHSQPGHLPAALLEWQLPLIVLLPERDAALATTLIGEGARFVLQADLPATAVVDLVSQSLSLAANSCKGYARPALESMQVPLLVVALDGEILAATERAARYLGLSAEAILGNQLGLELEAGAAHRVKRKAGNADLLLHPLPGCWQCKPALLVVVEQDPVTSEEQILLAASDHLQEMVIVTDANGRITYVNQAFLRHTGFGIDECIGSKPSMIKSGVHDRELYHGMWSAVTAGECWRGNLVNCKKDGTHYEVESTVFPLKDDSGNVLAFAAVQRDITYQVELAEQLQQAQKMEAIGRLAGGVAHDFNNLLTIILGNTQMALMRLPQDDPMRTKLDDIRMAAERATNLTRQLLVFSRKQERNTRLLDLNQLVTDFKKMIGRLIGEDIELGLKLCDDACMVKADPGRLEQVLMNLAVNARDAMPDGGTITLSIHQQTIDVSTNSDRFFGVKPGKYACISVADTGTGMDDATLNLIFQPFFTTKASGEGTGLGLATVYGIVKECDGHIAVDSTVGEGTVFHIYLPSDESGDDQLEETRLDERLALGQERILLVEDEDGVRQMAEEMLQIHGYEVISVATPRDALEICRSDQTFDLILTDIVMPGMNGIELVGEVMALRPDLKVLFMSGYPERQQQTRRLKLAANQYIQKPFTPMDLACKVREALDS